MALNLLSMLPPALRELDQYDDLKNFLEIISEVYDEMVADTKATLRAQSLENAPIWALSFIAKMLGAEIIRLNELESGSVEVDSDADGTADDWTYTGTGTPTMTDRRKSKVQKLTMDNTDTWAQALTLDETTQYIVEARVRVTSGTVRLGDVADNSKSIEITASTSGDSWTRYRILITPAAGAQDYGILATTASVVAYVDGVRIVKNSDQALMRVWLRNCVAEYQRKGSKDGIAAVITYLTGQDVPDETSPSATWVEQKLNKFPLIYNQQGCEYLWFGESGAPDPASGIPGDLSVYSTEWNTLETALDVNTVYMDFGAITNGNFDTGTDDWTATTGTAVVGSEKMLEGDKSIKLTGADISFTQDPITIDADKRYVASCWVWIPKGTSFTQLPRLLITEASAGSTIITGTVATASKFGSWQQIKAVLPYTNQVTSVAVVLEAASGGSIHLYADAFWMVVNKWVQIDIDDPGASKQAAMTDLLQQILIEYTPVGVEVDIVYV